MGAYLDKPITEKENEDGADERTAFGVSSMQGWRKEMEDAHVCAPNIKDKFNTAVYGVFDGHCGAEVARFVGLKIVDVLKRQKAFESSADPKTLGACLRDTFHALDVMIADYPSYGKQLESFKNKPKSSGSASEDVAAKRKVLQDSVNASLAEAKSNGGMSQQQAVQLMFKMMCLEKMGAAAEAAANDEEIADVGEDEDEDDLSIDAMDASPTTPQGQIEAGCTSVVVAIRNNKIVTANAGDSRAVLSRAGKAVALSWDHKPNDATELSRITAAGGFVSENGRVNGNLNLSRCIGDLKYKQNASVPPAAQVITAEPDIHIENLTPQDEFLILACDGIWDVLTRQEAVDEVRKRLGRTENISAICADILHNVCLAESTEGAMGKGCDNMTLMVVDLKTRRAGHA